MSEELIKSENSLAALTDARNEFVEITTYIRADQQFALELIENAEAAGTGKFDRDKVIREALDMLINERIKAVDLRGSQQERHFLKTGSD